MRGITATWACLECGHVPASLPEALLTMTRLSTPLTLFTITGNKTYYIYFRKVSSRRLKFKYLVFKEPSSCYLENTLEHFWPKVLGNWGAIVSRPECVGTRNREGCVPCRVPRCVTDREEVPSKSEQTVGTGCSNTSRQF